LFHQKVELQCERCHKIEGQGTSIVGPDLTGIGAKHPREYLLRAIVDPNAELAPGFDYTTLTLTDGRVLSGLVQNETADELRLTPPTEGAAPVVVQKAAIRQRAAASPMPPLVSLMTPRELRDLIEFLATNTGR
jgi:putative heme-binding domain-containing protein